MKKIFIILSLLSVIQFASAQEVTCSDLKSEKVFLAGTLRTLNDSRAYLDSIKILSAKESLELALNSRATDIVSGDFENYSFRSLPLSHYVIDPKAKIGLLGRLGKSISGKRYGSDDYVGEGRKWVYQNQSAEFLLGNDIHIVFDYQNAIERSSFRLRIQHIIDDYHVPMNKKLVCHFNKIQ